MYYTCSSLINTTLTQDPRRTLGTTIRLKVLTIYGLDWHRGLAGCYHYGHTCNSAQRIIGAPTDIYKYKYNYDQSAMIVPILRIYFAGNFSTCGKIFFESKSFLCFLSSKSSSTVGVNDALVKIEDSAATPCL